ncbi:APC family permease [Arcticibacterium luteifluviistationis]|uniref:Amino acid permease n=1 Tax=Arcticibacterium luteifluviistationis TaxID=1784714 RepID=A0A2Z4GE54_9BACT|nr:amino acid permease [Arcticibacterium luteifluviistationis]AWV99599.1 amino acid permease [Arcticibacterium luteifluviistationis]
MTNKGSKQNELLKILGVGFGIAVTLGGTIGTGILRTPGTIAAELGNPVLIMGVWVAVSLYAFLGVLCAIELGVSVPKAGSWYVYAQRAFGDYLGFLTGITSWLGTVASLGFGAYTIAEYLALIFPSLSIFIVPIAIAVLVILTGFHLVGTAVGGRSQEIMSAIKAVGLLAFVVVCFSYGSESVGHLSTGGIRRLTEGSLLIGIIAALQGIFYTFDGWHTAAYFTEENTDATKNLPKAMISGVLSIIVIYLLVNLAILYVLPMEDLQVSKLAAADAMAHVFGEESGKIITIFLLVSIIGIMNTQVMMTPRTLFSMSRDGLFFKRAQIVNKGGSPAFALLLTCSLSVMLIFIGKETSGRLLDIATFYFVFAYAMGFASLLMLRKKEPNLPRPYKVPFYPFLPWLMLILSMAFLVGAVISDSQNSLYAVIVLLLTYPVYRLIKVKNKS